MSTVTTPTNVAIIQRDATGDNDWIDLLGSANPNKSIGFNDAGVVSAISPFGIQYVKTWAQLQAAITAAGVAGGGTIFIDGTITIPPHVTSGFSGNGGLNIAVPNVVITGHANGTSVLKLQAGATFTYQIYSVININASNVTIENIKIEGTVITHLFNSVSTQRNAYGIHLGRGPTNLGISDITIRNTRIVNTGYALYQSGGATSPINRNLRFTGNKVQACGGGVYLSYSLDNSIISDNAINGDGAVYDGTKFSVENCIWIGLGITRCQVVNNHCTDHQRMGIEIFFPYQNTTTSSTAILASRGQSDAAIIVSGNTIENVGSMGISFTGARNCIVSNNTVTDCVYVGLELVGDATFTGQSPDKIVNVLAVGNAIKNVRATARRPKLTAPASPWLYGYSSIALDPTSCSITQSFSSRIALATTAAYTTGSKVFQLPVTKTYAEYAVGKEVQLKRTDNNNIWMIGTVTANDGTFITVNVTSLNASSNASLFSYLLCPYGLHTLSVPSLALDWSGNGGLMNGIPYTAGQRGTMLFIRNSDDSTGRNQYLRARVNSYTQNAATCEVFVEFSSATAFEEVTSWIAFTSQALVGISIDQIDGAKVIGNSLDIVLDSNSSERFGCQMIKANNIIFENNLLTRAGLRYLFLNASNHVSVRNNVFRSGSTLMVRDAVTRNITVLGEDVSYPEDITQNGYVARPCALYTLFTDIAPEYNASLPYNNCQYIFKDNTIVPVAGINALPTYVSASAVFSDQFSRPETLFNAGIALRHNTTDDGFNVTVTYPCPVLDYSQKWNNAQEAFTGYRFHADVGSSGASSRIFDVAAGSEQYVYLRTYTSTSSHNLTFVPYVPPSTFTQKAFVIPSAEETLFDGAVAAGAIALGVFVRATALNESGVVQGFIEGRVQTANAGTNAFSMYVTYAEGTAGTYTNWRIQFDTSALFVDKLSKLNLRSDVVLDYHTGTKIGTAATQKLGFWNATPVAQPAAVADATDAGTTQTQLNALLARLRAAGIIASS